MFGNQPGQARKTLGLTCKIHSLTKDILVEACIQPSCKDQPLLCAKCTRDNIHKSHNDKVMSFHEFAILIDNIRYDQTFEELARQKQGQIKQTKAEFLERFAQIKKLIEKAQSETMKYFDTYFDSQRKIIQEYVAIKLDPFDIQEGQSFETVSNQIKVKRAAYSLKQKSRTDLSEKLQKIKKSLTEKNRQISDSLIKSEQSVVKTIKSFVEQLGVSNFTHSIRKSTSTILSWNPLVKHFDLVIDGCRLTRKRNTTESRSVCCLGNLEMPNNSINTYSWSVKIASLEKGSYPLLGICKPEPLLDSSMVLNNLASPKNGHHCICANGQVYSCSKQKDWVDSFKFGSGDTIDLKFEPQRQKLTFAKGVEKFEMFVEKLKILQKYRLVVYLWSIGDAVELNQK